MSGQWTGGIDASEADDSKYEEFAKRADPNNREHMDLLEEMKQHTEKLKKMREHEDPRLSFATPEFKEAQRVFQENYKKNFGRPIEYGMVKQFPWSVPTLQKLEFPVDVDGNPWPLDAEGKPILKDVPEDDEPLL